MECALDPAWYVADYDDIYIKVPMDGVSIVKKYIHFINKFNSKWSWIFQKWTRKSINNTEP